MIKEQFIDFFKLFKIYDLKKLQKTGQVKIVQDRILMRKILSVQGTVSTENYTTFFCSQHPNIHFKQQYLYIQGYCEPGKAFTFQITYFLSNKQNKIICSTMYKEDFKRKSDNLSHFRLKMPTQKWTVLAIDLYSLVNWNQSFKNDQDLRLVFRLSSIEIRANSKIRGMFQSDVLYGPQNLPKDMQLPLRGGQTFFQKYSFLVTGLNLTEELKCEIDKFKQDQTNQENSQKNKDVKSKDKKTLSMNKTQKEKQRKSLNKKEQKTLSKDKNPKQGIKQNKKPSKSLTKSQLQKQKQNKNIEKNQQMIFDDDEDFEEQQALQPPRPAASLNLKIQAIEAISAINENIISCESWLIQPVRLQTHKKITKIHKGRLGKVLTSYNDGSVCVWDTIRKQSLFYFRSQLEDIKCLLMDYEGNIVIVGLDKLKREVIEIISDGAIIFKQISNFNIKNIKLISEESFQFGLMSVGYENVRIWTISPNNNIINGYSVYLGKVSRNVTYNDSCIVETVAGSYGFVSDSEGYVTKINLGEKKMQGVVKVDDCGIDHIRLIRYLNNQQKILIANEKGTIKLLSCTSMQSQLEYPLQNRIKSLYLKQNPKSHQQVPNLVLQSYNKTLAQLDLIESTFHFLIRSHYQSITHIEYEKTSTNEKITALKDDGKIFTASNDSTMRIWKLIPVSERQFVLKEEYQFLINGQNITHICSAKGSKPNGNFVYIITDTNKIRKIDTSNYQIVHQKILPSSSSSDGVVSFSINPQGKVLLIITQNNLMLLNPQLQVIQFRDLSEQYGTKRPKQQSKGNPNYLSGFNNHKKCFYYENPFTFQIEFYQLKDVSKPIFHISSLPEDKIISLEWIHDDIHCITEDQYRLYDKDCLLRSLPLTCDHEKQFKGNFELNFIAMNFPLVFKAYQIKSTNQSFISVQVLNKNGLNQTIKMPQRISHLKISKPIKNPQDHTESSWIGEIICAGGQSFGLYAVKYTILNTPDLFIYQDNTIEPERQFASFAGSQNQPKLKVINFQGQNISFIENTKRQNVLDISFSDNATILSGFRGQNTFQIPSKYSQSHFNPPAELRKLYEQEEKVFQQCKNVIFGDFFDKKQNNIPSNQYNQQEDETQRQEQMLPENGRIKMKIFFGVDSRQSLADDCFGQQKKKNYQMRRFGELGQFYWNSESKLISLLTNQHKSLLIHEFTEPSVTQKLIHLYSRPSSISWSPSFANSSQTLTKSMNYFVVCFNSIIKLYNADNKVNFIRSIECDLLIKDKHVIFSSFVTNCNSFLCALTYKIDKGIQNQSSNNNTRSSSVYRPKQNKLYIFVIEISTGKIVSSSYREVKHVKKSKSQFQYEKSIKQNFSLVPNRYSTNKSLQFIFKGSNEVSFYRVSSMFTLQTLQVEEIYNLTKEKTEQLTTARYIKVEGDVYVLIGTQNGSVIIVDSRSSGIVLVLMGLLDNTAGKGKSENCISKIEFIEQHIIENEIHDCSKLIFFCASSNSIKIIPLINGLNTLIKQLQQLTSSTLLANQSFSQQQHSVSSQFDHKSSSIKFINSDSEITSISPLNNTTQQLILTKSSTLWLVDYEDYCAIKIFSPHCQTINDAYLLDTNDPSKRLFISCSEDGYVKVSDISKLQQQLQIYKPRKQATCLQIQGSFTVCGFKDEIYFYEGLLQQHQNESKNFNYLGSLQIQNQSILKIKNIPHSDNYYILTDQKVYVIYIRRKQQPNITGMSKSNISKYTNKNMVESSSNFINTSSKLLPKIQIQIQIQEITSFNSIQNKTDTKGVTSNWKPLWIQINPLRLYDEFSIGFRCGKVQTWERKCLKRTLNPLQQLSHVQQLQYYLIDVYNRKEVLEPYIQFISQREYMISLSELNKIEVRNFKQHSIVREIAFSEQSLSGIKTFKYFLFKNNEDKKGTNNKSYHTNLTSLKNGPLLLISDNFGYLNICDMNGLVIEKQKVFNSPIQSIEVINEEKSQFIAFSVLLKSSHFISILNIFY